MATKSAELLLELEMPTTLLAKDRALQRWKEGTHGAEGEKRLFIGLNIAQVLWGETVHRSGAAMPRPQALVSRQRKSGIRARRDCEGNR